MGTMDRSQQGDHMNDATHSGILTWPLETMNGPEGEKVIDLKECAYGWTSGGLRWKSDGTHPQAYFRITICDDPPGWGPTYFGLKVDSIRPLTSAEIRKQLQAHIDEAHTPLCLAREEKTIAIAKCEKAAMAYVEACKALDQFDKEHGGHTQ